MTIEEKFEGDKKKEDTHSYKGWMNSDSFWKRAFGVWLHNLAINGIFVIIYIISILALLMLIK